MLSKTSIDIKRQVVLGYLIRQIGPLVWLNEDKKPGNLVARDFFGRTLRLRPMKTKIVLERCEGTTNYGRLWVTLSKYPISKLYEELI